MEDPTRADAQPAGDGEDNPGTVDSTATELPPTDEQPAEAKPVEQPEAAADDEQQAGRELEQVKRGGASASLIVAKDPTEIMEKAGAIAKTMTEFIEAQGLAVHVGGKRKHVEVGGWQSLGALFGAFGGEALHAETVWTQMVNDPDTGKPKRTKYDVHVKDWEWVVPDGGGKKQKRLKAERDYTVDGFDWEARVEVRTASGTLVGVAEAMCSRAEDKWAKRDDYALRSMAETRAESRAYRRAAGWIVHLAGYSPTPAEEMGAQPGAEHPQGQAAAPPWYVGDVDKQEYASAIKRGLRLLVDPRVNVMSFVGLDQAADLPEELAGAVPSSITDEDVQRAADRAWDAIAAIPAMGPDGKQPDESESKSVRLLAAKTVIAVAGEFFKLREAAQAAVGAAEAERAKAAEKDG